MASDNNPFDDFNEDAGGGGNESPAPRPSSSRSSGGGGGDWFGRLGISGKLLFIGSIVGVISCLLPAISASVNIMGVSKSNSDMVIEKWPGILGFLGFGGCIALAFLMYKPGGQSLPGLGWLPLAITGAVTLFALINLIAKMGDVSDAKALMGGGFGGAVNVSVGIGSYVFLLSAGAALAGGIMKAKEDKVF